MRKRRTRVTAHYVGELNTPIEIHPDLSDSVGSVAFVNKEWTAEISPGDVSGAVMLPDGDHHSGEIQSLVIGITRRVVVDRSGTSPVLDMDEDREFEGALVAAVSRFLTHVRVLTHQTWLDDRLPVRSYRVTFHLPDRTLVSTTRGGGSDSRTPLQFLDLLSLSPDDFYSELDSGRWLRIIETIQSPDAPPRQAFLLAEAADLLSRHHYQRALLLAAISLEISLARACRKGMEDRGLNSPEAELLVGKLSTERGLFALLDIAAVFDPWIEKNKKDISKAITNRNNVAHGRSVRVEAIDVRQLIRLSRRIDDPTARTGTGATYY